MKHILLAVAIVGSALIGSLGLEEVGECKTAQPRSLEGETRDGSILFRIVNRELATTVRVCLLDPNDRRVFDATLEVPAMSQVDQRAWVPVGGYRTLFMLETPHGSASLGQHADLTVCPTRSAISKAYTEEGALAGHGIAGGGVSCDESPPPAPAGQGMEAPVLAPLPDSGGDEPAYRWFALGGLALVGLVFAFPRPRYLALALFSRFQGPEVLDQPIRGQIYDVVRVNPGVNAHRLANTLGLGSGQTRYHLGVLRRNRIVTEIRRGSLRCYFAAGVASPERLRATAFLRHAGAERLYDAVLSMPTSSLTQLASVAGLTLSAASKSLDRLVEGGLAERVQEGRELRVRPTNLRPLLPLIESNPSREAPAVS